jgi:hypothetical protein
MHLQQSYAPLHRVPQHFNVFIRQDLKLSWPHVQELMDETRRQLGTTTQLLASLCARSGCQPPSDDGAFATYDKVLQEWDAAMARQQLGEHSGVARHSLWGTRVASRPRLGAAAATGYCMQDGPACQDALHVPTAFPDGLTLSSQPQHAVRHT